MLICMICSHVIYEIRRRKILEIQIEVEEQKFNTFSTVYIETLPITQ